MNHKLRLVLQTMIWMFCSCSVEAQKKPTLLNTSLTKPEMAVVYIGVDNVFSLYGEIPGKYIRMERSGGPLELRPGTALRTILKYTQKGTDTLRVFDNDKLIIEKIYEIREMGEYVINLKNSRGNTMSVEELLSSKSLEVQMANEYYKPKLKVIAFTVALLDPKGKIIQKMALQGNSFNDFLQAQKERLTPKSTLSFSEIKTASKDGNTKNFENYSIVLK